jgi:hypothetical protein
MTRHIVGVAIGLATVVGAVNILRGQGVPQPGDPLPGLSAREFAEFRLGLDDFM